CVLFFFHSPADLRHLPSFPTRRSSDLHQGFLVPRTRGHRWPSGHLALPRAKRETRRSVGHSRPNGIPSAATAPSSWTSPSRSARDRKSTRLNSSHVKISYAVFCLKKKK